MRLAILRELPITLVESNLLGFLSYCQTRGERYLQNHPTFPNGAKGWDFTFDPLTSRPGHRLGDHSKAPRISRHWTNPLPHRLILESLKFRQLRGK